MSKNSQAYIVFSALEVANICGVVNQTAINWIRREHLKAFKTPGGQFRVYLDDLVEFMQKRKMRVPQHIMEIHEEGALNQASVLIVDDDKGLNSVLAKYLERAHERIVVYQAFDGFEAGAQLVDKKPKCVLLDLNLPGVDGLELCKKIYNSEEFGKPFVCVITGLEDKTLEKQVKDLGAIEFFTKPLDLVAVAEKLKKLLNLES